MESYVAKPVKLHIGSGHCFGFSDLLGRAGRSDGLSLPPGYGITSPLEGSEFVFEPCAEEDPETGGATAHAPPGTHTT